MSILKRPGVKKNRRWLDVFGVKLVYIQIEEKLIYTDSQTLRCTGIYNGYAARK